MLFLNGYNLTLNHFPNGELNILNIEEAIKLRRGTRPHHFVLKYENDKDLMALYFAEKQVYKRTGRLSELSIAYMPYSRMDRAETPTTPFMLDFVCDFINDMSFENVYVHEPHSSVTIDLLDDAIAVYDNISLVKEVQRLEDFNEDTDYLVFPDKGAQERYDGKISSKNMLVGEKKRDFATGEIQGLELKGDTSKIVTDESTAIIVDDLSSYGGTFIRTAKELYALGFRKVVLLVCHAENSIFKGDLFLNICEVYTTDSILTEHTHWQNQKYKDRLHVFGLIEQMKEGNQK